MSNKPAFIRAKQKIADAKNWRGDVNISLGDETVTFQHRLLTESEFLDIKKELQLSEIQQSNNAGQTEAQERLLELQKQEDLSQEEERELERLSAEVANQTDEIEDALGENGYDLLMDAGRKTIEPSDEDVNYVYDECTPDEMRDALGVDTLPNPLMKSDVRELLSDEIASMVEDQPYPIKLNVGLQALSETISVLGNGLQK